MAHYLIIDGNSVGRAANSSPKLSVGGIHTQAIYGYLQTIRQLRISNPASKFIILWDGKAKWRFDLFPMYKGNRSDTPEKIKDREMYKAQVPAIQAALSHLGIPQLTDLDSEADDLAGYLVQTLAVEGGHRVTLISGDKDWQQLVGKNVDWVDHRDGKTCNFGNFRQITGFDSPKQFIEAKALVGDTSDNIPGVGGIGATNIVDFFNHHGSVEKFLNTYTKKVGNGEKVTKAYFNFVHNIAPKDSTKYGKMMPMQDAFERNLKLMTLANYKPKKSSMQHDNGKFDPVAFNELCQEYCFRTITVRLDSWLLPFQR